MRQNAMNIGFYAIVKIGFLYYSIGRMRAIGLSLPRRASDIPRPGASKRPPIHDIGGQNSRKKSPGTGPGQTERRKNMC